MIYVKRSYPAPASLAKEAEKERGKYDKEDVIQRLRMDFNDKCYICGLTNLQDPQVEHLLPHKNRSIPERVFDWDNLFWSCGHCNSVKNRSLFDEGILDCCKTDPESLLDFEWNESGVTVHVLDMGDEKAMRTARLLQDVFGLQNTGMRTYKTQQRYNALTEEMNKFFKVLHRWNDSKDSKLETRKLRAMLRRESGFAEYKRSYIRNHAKEYIELLDYIA